MLTVHERERQREQQQQDDPQMLALLLLRALHTKRAKACDGEKTDDGEQYDPGGGRENVPRLAPHWDQALKSEDANHE